VVGVEEDEGAAAAAFDAIALPGHGREVRHPA
jgi:hypothetical protein